MNKCVFFTAKEGSSKEFSMAKLADEKIISPLDVDNFIKQNRRFPCNLVLVQKRITKNGITQNINVPEKEFFDYQYNQFAYYLLSERLKNCIEENKGSKDSFSWIKVPVSSETETRDYYIPIFESIPDVLDLELTTRVPANNAILVPCFASEKLEGHNFFPKETSFGVLPRGIYVSESMKKILQKQKFDNIKFEKVKCSLGGTIIS
ncbi:imm11 family protein [Treponema sp. C6A8]|uniref:imm11 family protein n=1 Tax=Treponema sp. C6A8 TaxID=1410609 RepID=UPI0004805AF1|nr:DUF1629 domain-containing protein [Treponema sp. C6A8]